jgi:hypothetical protein
MFNDMIFVIGMVRSFTIQKLCLPSAWKVFQTKYIWSGKKSNLQE